MNIPSQITAEMNKPFRLALMPIVLTDKWQYAIVSVLNISGYLIGGMYWPNQSNKLSFFDVATGIPVTIKKDDIAQVNDNINEIIKALDPIFRAVVGGTETQKVLGEGLGKSYLMAIQEYGKRPKVFWFKGTEPVVKEAFHKLYKDTPENEKIYHKLFDAGEVGQ